MKDPPDHVTGRVDTHAEAHVAAAVCCWSQRLLGTASFAGAREPGHLGLGRRLSDRDIEAAKLEALGPDATVSRSTVSRICEQTRTEVDG
jgi:hypothetical protein